MDVCIPSIFRRVGLANVFRSEAMTCRIGWNTFGFIRVALRILSCIGLSLAAIFSSQVALCINTHTKIQIYTLTPF